MEPLPALLIAHMASSFIQPVAFSLINGITGKGAIRSGKRQECGILLLLALPLMMMMNHEGLKRSHTGLRKI